MRRTPLLVLPALALAAVVPIQAGPSQAAVEGQATQDARRADRYGEVRNILPPGSNGRATAVDVLLLGGTEATADTPTNFADQLEMYDALTIKEPEALTEADLDTLFKDAGFVPEEVVSTATPREGVTIERDAFGVPFITGVTYDDVQFGAGYAAIEDRMFLMDVLRHTGEARLAEFVGDSPGNVAMDQGQLRTAFYTEEEAAEQVEIAAKRAGADGPRLLSAVDASSRGSTPPRATCARCRSRPAVRSSTPHCRRSLRTGTVPTSSTSHRSWAASSARAAASRRPTLSGTRRWWSGSARRGRARL